MGTWLSPFSFSHNSVSMTDRKVGMTDRKMTDLRPLMLWSDRRLRSNPAMWQIVAQDRVGQSDQILFLMMDCCFYKGVLPVYLLRSSKWPEWWSQTTRIGGFRLSEVSFKSGSFSHWSSLGPLAKCSHLDGTWTASGHSEARPNGLSDHSLSERHLWLGIWTSVSQTLVKHSINSTNATT